MGWLRLKRWCHESPVFPLRGWKHLLLPIGLLLSMAIYSIHRHWHVVLPDCKHQACLQAAKAPSNPRAALELVLTSLESTPSGLCTSGLVPFIQSVSWLCAPTAGGRIRWSGRRVLRSWQAGSLPGLGTSLKSAVTTIPKFFRKKRGAFSNRGLPFRIVSC